MKRLMFILIISLIGISVFIYIKTLNLNGYQAKAEEKVYRNSFSQQKVNILDVINENMLLRDEKLYKGNSIKVGILDTGIDYNNKELRIQDGVSTINDTNNYMDYNGHGTHVAGIIESVTAHKNNSVGISPSVQLFAIKALNDKGDAKASSVIAGVQWAIDHHIDVLNMSIGSEINSKGIRNILEKAYKSGMFIVAPVGNNGYSIKSNITYPAKYDIVFSVGSVNNKLKRSAFSSMGSELDIVAPGEKIYGPSLNNSHTYETGTSMASPYVAGVAALLLSANKDLSPNDLKNILELSADPLGDIHKYGNGIIDIPRALNLALLKKKNVKLYKHHTILYKDVII
ncbi:S8 family peptidase (plasmid) [Priestia megaterium NCT-2]|uniref:S8 family peptidase n=1 Tax=Priestia megaterium TaxID=1404 RepID=UPI000EB638CB|nr:S8 family peptidase [Priestia megaterium]AYE53782.1 S8 family peptidase [Priestia megaterium NCT-2]